MDLPKYISYTPATETRGDFFTVEITRGGTKLLKKKTSQSKSISYDDKLKEAKSILVTELSAHPEWNIQSPLMNDHSISLALPSHRALPSVPLPAGLSSLPKYVRYVKASGPRGEGFEYERKLPDGTRTVISTSRSKNVSINDKYQELVTKMKNANIVIS